MDTEGNAIERRSRYGTDVSLAMTPKAYQPIGGYGSNVVIRSADRLGIMKRTLV